MEAGDEESGRRGSRGRPFSVSEVNRTSRSINDTRQAGVRMIYPTSPRARTRIDTDIFDLASDFPGTYALTSGTKRVDGRIQEDLVLSSAIGFSGGVELLRERGRSTYIVGSTGQEIPIERTMAGGRWVYES